MAKFDRWQGSPKGLNIRITILRIMIRKFINREEELHFLNKRYKERFDFFVIYGRRRIGKTELIKEFIKDKPHLYFLSDKAGTESNTNRLKERMAEELKKPMIASMDLQEIFQDFVSNMQRKYVIILDEFSYLVEKDEAIPSVFQRVIDEVLSKTNLLLILCGSSVSMMEQGIMSYQSPLYGRKTAHIKLGEIPFAHLRSFFPKNTLRQDIEFWSILGGVPFYLQYFSDTKTALDNSKEQILHKTGKMYEEVDFILQEELRESAVYKTILAAIASGSTKVVEIAQKTGIRASDLDKYLKVLLRLGFIKKEHPITSFNTKKTFYCISNNFFHFWFSFGEPNKSALEVGEWERSNRDIEQRFGSYVGKQFEEFVRQQFSVFGFAHQHVGRWWGHWRENGKRREVEIDIVALNEKTKEILLGECKWKDHVDPIPLLEDLQRKATYVAWPSRETSYALFARSFSKKVSLYAADRKVSCFDLADMEKCLRKK